MQNEISRLNQAIQNDHCAISQQIAEVRGMLHAEHRANAVRKGGRELLVGKNEVFYAAEFYENGQIKDSIPLFTQYYGEWTMSRIVFAPECNCPELMLLQDEGKLHQVIFRKKQLRKDIVDAILKAGFSFNHRLKESAIKEMLARFFLPEAENCTRTFLYPHLPGWSGSVFLSAEVDILKGWQHELRLPIGRREFKECGEDEAVLKKYAEQIARIDDPNARIIVLLYPFISAMSTLLHKRGMRFRKILNIICDEMRFADEACYFLQIFNRNQIGATAIELPSKKFLDRLKEAKDEAVLVRLSGDDEGYEKKKAENNVKKAVQLFTYGENLESPYNRKILATFVVISDVPLYSANTLEATWTRESLKRERFQKTQWDRLSTDLFDAWKKTLIKLKRCLPLVRMRMRMRMMRLRLQRVYGSYLEAFSKASI